jgi:hypothetical protein
MAAVIDAIVKASDVVPVLATDESLRRNFTSFGRGSFRSERSALASARRHVREGAERVVVVHCEADRLYSEAWMVGQVRS